MRGTIKYANCWEDADLLLSTTSLPENSNILSIASGGDNSLALLTTHPKMLYAVDVNVAQLHLCELKAASFSALAYDDLLQFLFGTSRSKELFETVKSSLSAPCRKYWEANESSIHKGVLHSGKFERYFRFFRKKLMPFIHSQRTITMLLDDKTEQEQIDLYFKKWDSGPWKFLFKLFFSKFIMGTFGRTKAYLDQVDIPVGTFIYDQAKLHLQSKACQSNYFLHYIFTGCFKPQLPFYLRIEHYETIKNNLSAMSLKHGDVKDLIKQENDLNCCNFSNIFEYMDKEAFASFHQLLLEHLPPKASINYWNLMVDRVFSDSFPASFSRSQQQMASTDKGFFYKRFVSDIKK